VKAVKFVFWGLIISFNSRVHFSKLVKDRLCERERERSDSVSFTSIQYYTAAKYATSNAKQLPAISPFKAIKGAEFLGSIIECYWFLLNGKRLLVIRSLRFDWRLFGCKGHLRAGLPNVIVRSAHRKQHFYPMLGTVKNVSPAGCRGTVYANRSWLM